MPEISQETAKLIEDIRLAVEKGGQFIAEQAPPLAQELIIYGRFKWSVLLGIWVITLLWCSYNWATWKTRDYPRLRDVNREPGTGVAAFRTAAHGAITIASLCGFAVCFPWFSMVWFAPRAYLLYAIRVIAGIGDCR